MIRLRIKTRMTSLTWVMEVRGIQFQTVKIKESRNGPVHTVNHALTNTCTIMLWQSIPQKRLIPMLNVYVIPSSRIVGLVTLSRGLS